MCGISGIYGWKNKSEREQFVESMNENMAHRGPDHSALF